MNITVAEARRLGANTVKNLRYQVEQGGYILHYNHSTARIERYPWAISSKDGRGVEEHYSFPMALLALAALARSEIRPPQRFDPRCSEDEDISAFIRAGGDALCETCWQELWRHPYCPARDARADDGTGRMYSWLHVLCDGTHVKL